MNNTTLEIAQIAKVSVQEASEIYEVLMSEYLVDFSEATMREFKQAIKFASTFIANGHSWE